MDLTIFTMTHKPFPAPPDPMYCPLQVGSEGRADLGFLRDNTGDQISALNCYYSELTGFYWIWKNIRTDGYVGTCHYRRYLLNGQDKIFTKSEYEELLGRYDLITTKKVLLNNPYHYGFSANHNIHALDMTGQVISELYPEDSVLFQKLVNGPETYFGNILVTSKALFDEYCSWLFSIFFEVQRRIDLDTDEDEYHRRVFGFISEFLLLVWVRKKGLRVCECKVGMIGEKAETGEIKRALAGYFRKKDIDGAREYFLAQHKARPDILMEASDITGELHLCMQMIACAQMEYESHGSSIFDRECEYEKLIRLFSELNIIMSRALYRSVGGEPVFTKEEQEFLQKNQVSREMLYTAKMVSLAAKQPNRVDD